MTPLKVKFIDEIKVLKILNEPIKTFPVYTGCGVKVFKEKLVLHENGMDSNHHLSPIQENETYQEPDTFFRPTALIESEGEKHTFGFRTPSKNGSMLEKADSAIKNQKAGNTPKTPRSCRTPKTPQTPKTPLNRTPKTPSTPLRRIPRTTKSVYRTPTCKDSSRKSLSRRSSNSGTPETPYSFRTKVKKRIANIVYHDESGEDFDDSDVDKDYPPPDSEGSDDDSDDDYVKDVNENETPDRRKTLLKSFPRTPLRTPRRGREPKVDVDMAASTDEYFVHNSETNACVTSDHTLNKLENPRLGPEALKSLLEGAIKSHENERKELIEDHMTLFPHWMTLLYEGFSIFLCGVGSKKQLLSLFQKRLLSDTDHLVVNGFFPSLTVKSIMMSIIEEIMELEAHPQGLSDQLRLISSHYNEPTSDPLFLIIHNLDGPMLRNEKAQSVLSQLASFTHVHLIASLDHINAPLIFDGNKYSCYNPLWWDATTLAPYTEETSYENSLLVQQTGGLVLSSLIHVFKSLTPNAKGIFLLLAKHQLSEKDNSNYTGLSFGDLYQRCRESFLVNSDLTLRAQLTEFKDHKLLKTKKSFDGLENLVIPLEPSTLREFLDQHE